MCKRCGKDCKRVPDEFGTGELVCQFCDICNQNDHDEYDCTNICMNFYAGCRNPKVEGSPHCIYCQAVDYMTNCAGVNGNACGDKFSEEYPHESSSPKTIYGHQFILRYCSGCTFNIEWKKGNINYEGYDLEEVSEEA